MSGAGPIRATHAPRHVTPSDRAAVERVLRAECGTEPRWWSNGPGDTYARHDHPYHKVLYCTAGSIAFHLDDGNVVLHPGDRLDLPPGTAHAATVGADGVTCVEAPRAA